MFHSFHTYALSGIGRHKQVNFGIHGRVFPFLDALTGRSDLEWDSMILTLHVPPPARGQRLCDIDEL